jgi:hypothetical protein
MLSPEVLKQFGRTNAAYTRIVILTGTIYMNDEGRNAANAYSRVRVRRFARVGIVLITYEP